jgi:hypothetical protein
MPAEDGCLEEGVQRGSTPPVTPSSRRSRQQESVTTFGGRRPAVHVPRHRLVPRSVGDDLLQPAILFLDLLEPADLADPHPAVLPLPAVERRLRDPELAAELWHRRAGPSFRSGLRFGVSTNVAPQALIHRTLDSRRGGPRCVSPLVLVLQLNPSHAAPEERWRRLRAETVMPLRAFRDLVQVAPG